MIRNLAEQKQSYEKNPIRVPLFGDFFDDERTNLLRHSMEKN